MKADITQKKKMASLAELSLRDHKMDFLLEASADRSAADLASKAIEPLSNIENEIGGSKMPQTAAGIRKSINNVNKKISSTPGLATSVMSAFGLASKHKELVDEITKTEVLKFSILNAMDAVRLLLLTEYKKIDKFYTDQVISLQVIPPPATPAGATPPLARFAPAKTVPFSEAKALGDNYAIYIRETKFMLIGPETTAPLMAARLDIRGAPPMFTRVPAGKLFFVQRDAEGDPAPVLGPLKVKFLGISAPPAPGVLNQKVEDVARARTFNVRKVVTDNFKVSTAAASKIENAFRMFKGRSPDLKPDAAFLRPGVLAAEIEKLTLKDFKECFAAFTENTTNDAGNMETYDLSDTLVLTGLGAITAMFGGTRGSPTGAAGGPAAGSSGGGGGSAGGGGGAAPGSGGGSPGGGGSSIPPRSQSFNDFIRTTAVVKGSTAAERAANLNNLMNLVDADAMRRELNRVVGPSFVFTEGHSIDRWKKLAGIKENE